MNRAEILDRVPLHAAPLDPMEPPATAGQEAGWLAASLIAQALASIGSGGWLLSRLSQSADPWLTALAGGVLLASGVTILAFMGWVRR